MDWNFILVEYKNYLKLEKNASPHTIDAYLNDIQKLQVYAELQNPKLVLTQIVRKNLEEFIAYLIENFSIQESTQARIISSIKSFFGFLVYQNF